MRYHCYNPVYIPTGIKLEEKNFSRYDLQYFRKLLLYFETEIGFFACVLIPRNHLQILNLL